MRGVPGWQLTRCIVTTLLRGAESIRMIYRARRDVFLYFFCILGEGFSGVEKYVVGLRYNFALFFPLNWAVKLENFRLNLRMNSLVVPYWAQKRARVAKKRPILCNMTLWFSSGSFFKRISVFAYYFSAHSESREWWISWEPYFSGTY